MMQGNKDNSAEHHYNKEENDLSQAEYVRGYNDGYLIAKFEPEVFKEYKLTDKNSTNDPYIAGIANGKTQREKESILEQIKESKELQKERDRVKHRGRGR